MLSLLHEPVKIGEMHDPREIGLEEFNTVPGNEMCDHALNLANELRSINAPIPSRLRPFQGKISTHQVRRCPRVEVSLKRDSATDGQ